jgi:hypothetical protein
MVYQQKNKCFVFEFYQQCMTGSFPIERMSFDPDCCVIFANGFLSVLEGIMFWLTADQQLYS